MTNRFRLTLLIAISVLVLACGGGGKAVSPEDGARREALSGFKARASAPVWKAVEWWDSGDSGPDDLKESLAEYRQNKAGCTK